MKHSLVRQTIVETASHLFYQNGYNLTGINEIIREAGIAKATLYSHFKSKDDICLAYLKFKNETFLEDIKAYATSKPKGKSQLLALFDFLSSFFKDKDFNGCWCINTVSEIPKEKEFIKNEIQKQKNNFIEVIQDLIDHNLDKAPKHLAKQIYLLYECAVSESHLHQDNWPITTSRDLCAKLLT